MSASSRPVESDLPPLGEVLDFMRLLWRLDHALQRRSKHMEQTVGVTGPQRLVLRIVGRFPGIPAGHLAELLHVHPSTLTGVIKRLERHRLLRKRVDPRDGRRVLLSLTEAGRSVDAVSEGTVETAVHEALSRASLRDVEAARQVLTSLAERLAPAAEEPPP